jgi:hypothetical protein
MSFQNIQLPGIVVSELYKDLLVATQGPSAGSKSVAPPAHIDIPQKEDDQPDTYKFLGKNQRQVVIIVNYPNEVFIQEEDLQVLTKILGACKLNLGDVAIVNAAGLQPEIGRLKDQFKPEKMLLFGIGPAEIGLPISFPEFKQQSYAGTTFICAPAVSKMNGETEENRLLKRKLWDSLKPLFGI